MIPEDATRQKWLESTLDRLRSFWNQRHPREISWQEATGLISEPWLKDHFGTPPTIDIGALRGALIDQTPQTSGPPTPASAAALSKQFKNMKVDAALIPAPPPSRPPKTKRRRGSPGTRGKAALEKLREMYRSGKITKAELAGELKMDAIAHAIGLRRTRANDIVDIFLTELEV